MRLRLPGRLQSPGRYEHAANPNLAAAYGNRRENLLNAKTTLQRFQATIEQTLKLTPKNAELEAELASVQVRIGGVRHLLHETGDSMPLSKAGLAVLRSAAGKDQTSPMVLDLVVGLPASGTNLPPRSSICVGMRRTRCHSHASQDTCLAALAGPGISLHRADRERPRGGQRRPGPSANLAAGSN